MLAEISLANIGSRLEVEKLICKVEDLILHTGALLVIC